MSEGSGGRWIAPDEAAAHEHSHGALYICPNRLEGQEPYFMSARSPGETISVATTIGLFASLTLHTTFTGVIWAC
jgi:hypothetical protein